MTPIRNLKAAASEDLLAFEGCAFPPVSLGPAGDCRAGTLDLRKGFFIPRTK